MDIRTRTSYRTAVLALATGALLPALAAAQAPQYTASIYAYLPTISGSTAFPVSSGGSSVNVTADQILDSLKMTFMGSLDVHNGRWGAFTDVVYVDVGAGKSNSRDFSIGSIGLPAGTTADLNLDLKILSWTLAGEYRMASDPAFTIDLLAGARLADVRERLNYSISGDLGPIAAPGRSGTVEVDQSFWDAIIGVKGRYQFGAERRWAVPFYLDFGAGQSDRTTQAAIGLGYSFQWGEVTAMWRYLDYQFKSGKNIEDINFNGPMIGANFRW